MRRLQKPIGVYLGTILIILSYGIMPFAPTFNAFGDTYILRYGALPFNGSIDLLRGNEGESPFLLVFISLFLSIFSVASAIWALVGHNEGRISLLAFVSLNYLWWTFLIVTVLASIESGDPRIIELVISLIQPTVIIGIIWWYFSNKDVVAYYQQQSELQHDRY